MSYAAVNPAYSGGGIFMPRQGLGVLYTGEQMTEPRTVNGYTYLIVKPEYVPAARQMLSLMAPTTTGVSTKRGFPLHFINATLPAVAGQPTADDWITEQHDAGMGIIIQDVTPEGAAVGAAAPEHIGLLSAALAERDNNAVLLDPKGGWIAHKQPGGGEQPGGPAAKAEVPWVTIALVGGAALFVGAIGLSLSRRPSR